ncbi:MULTISPECIES: thioesterase domain-containing protein [unclassified Bradyrhizobium]|uniref:thioesterase domain-containing protein n=1 Tax=Bradyrhizobium sp. USDA 4541 TaxID=2817704 RepID=UPI0020A09224|nr:alpha/beta fold hydrolase [Bradyrhizobium sp. USDA 4541]MCP1847897.1 thioesterase domain-containing protein [Bradyrhizobium sp. USDA 4541]MCP1911803.1 thioesterase domain-containing protein [Bradyrhizobium elkanii]
MSASSMKSPMSAHVMQFSELLADLAVKDIKVWVDGDRLRCNAPAGALTAELRDQLQGRKGEIIAFLNMATAAAKQPSAIVPLQSRGTRIPIYAVPGHVGAPSSFLDLSKHLGVDQPFYALQPPGFDGQSEPMDRVEDIAEYFARQIVEYQPTGPYIIVGYCSGAPTAFELAKILGQRESEVSCVALFGPLHPTTYGEWPRRLYFIARGKAESFLHETAKLPTFGARLRYFGSRLREHVRALVPLVGKSNEPVATDPVLASRALLKSTAIAAFQRYTPTPYSGRVCIILPNKAWLRSGAAPHRWLRVVPHAEFYFGPDDCNEASMLMEPDAPAIANLYREATQKQND